MAGIDLEREFIPLKIAVITLSDTRDETTDTSGGYLVEALTGAGHISVGKTILKDSRRDLEALLRKHIADPGVDVVICNGGTGITPRDITPETLQAVSDKEIPGFGEVFRWQSYEKIGTSTLQSRATAGVAGATLLFALPGSTNACKDGWKGILELQLDSRHRPCNFAQLLPRLRSEKADD